MESLEGVASLIGQLSLARRHYNGFVTQALATPTKREVFPEINDDYLSLEVRILMMVIFNYLNIFFVYSHIVKCRRCSTEVTVIGAVLSLTTPPTRYRTVYNL